MHTLPGSPARRSGHLTALMQRWLFDCDVRDATGQPVKVTAHQFRDTVGTRMINNEVSLDVVQRMLDHGSPEMTARYATINRRAVVRADRGLRDLDAEGAPISFQSVARRAGVSRQWLYTQPALRSEIERLRDRAPADGQQRQGRSV